MVSYIFFTNTVVYQFSVLSECEDSVVYARISIVRFRELSNSSIDRQHCLERQYLVVIIDSLILYPYLLQTLHFLFFVLGKNVKILVEILLKDLQYYPINHLLNFPTNVFPSMSSLGVELLTIRIQTPCLNH